MLARGYSLSRKKGETKPLEDARELKVGDEVETRLARGSYRARVEETSPDAAARDRSDEGGAR